MTTPLSFVRRAAIGTLFTLMLSTPALCQTFPPVAGVPRPPALTPLGPRPMTSQNLPPVVRSVDLAGPRFGLTLLSQGVVDALADRNIHVQPYITQFGWQLERQFFTRESGVTMVSEWVGLLGGLDQSVALPSLSWLVGVRTRDGAEFGIGPNITPAGAALVFATGMTFRTGGMNIPVNVAIVPSKAGTRVTVLTGFSLRRR